MDKPFSQACENNKSPIFEVIKDYFDQSELILEIGSGTGQHAVYFADKLPQAYWQTSDQSPYIKGINLRINEYHKYNLGRPFTIDVMQKNWSIQSCDGIYSANTSHIMSWAMVEKMFEGVSKILKPNGCFCLYGPFNFAGKYTSSSNESFDQMLRARDPESGLRNFEDIENFAVQLGLKFIKRHDLPANNCILVWQSRTD